MTTVTRASFLQRIFSVFSQPGKGEGVTARLVIGLWAVTAKDDALPTCLIVVH